MIKRSVGETEAVVNRVWAQRLGVSAHAFGDGEPLFIARPKMRAAVTVRLGARTVVAAPPQALALLRTLATAQLVDSGALLSALASLRPELLGAASLSFLSAQPTVPKVAGTSWIATAADLETVLGHCSAEEQEESGLETMTDRWAAGERPDLPGAAAGYEVWGGGVAHLGVAVAAVHRGRGLGLLAAYAAASAARSAGLVPQWRCRWGHLPSARVAERLGFVPGGEQVAINLLGRS